MKRLRFVTKTIRLTARLPFSSDKLRYMLISLSGRAPTQMNPVIKNFISFRLLYILVGGFLFFLSSAAFDAIFRMSHYRAHIERLALHLINQPFYRFRQFNLLSSSHLGTIPC
jgi:hypothetical protein